MTKKDYILIAEALAEARPNGWQSGTGIPEYQVWGSCVMWMAANLASENVNFNREKFIDHCRLT